MSNPVPNCNEKVVLETMMTTGEAKKTIEHIISHYTKLIADKIEDGGFESVRIPYFGLFEAKHKELQWRAFYQSLPKTKTRKK